MRDDQCSKGKCCANARNPPRGPREGVIVGDVLDALNALGGVHAWRNNTGRASIRGRSVQFGDRGSADVLACVKGRFLAVECKTSTGRQSPDQKRWADTIVQAGGLYVLARSAADAVRAARELGATTGAVPSRRVFHGATSGSGSFEVGIGPDGEPGIYEVP